ncbi:tRNA-guanine transglycosylase [Spirulina sp. CS-785/01]|uniref:tRNA-guanine transglycosylase n=1 Tax=Spirulina sp. CS-785/01 TaxID=3021716 RepID=UPI0023308268|nr:tRNA-guanine transglycosylase [Spirulina sp. CS-785/01]MDB9314987.1 tRNA-guanine transglycosylase [Spirulina sp. CS-785/01]
MFNSQEYEHGRLGELKVDQHIVETPFLFPVVSLVTSTKASGGGIWKYILQANMNQGILRRNIPVMSQVLHFLNFIPKKINGLNTWRELGIRQRYQEDTGVKYNAPIFLDSGGFQLLSKKNIDLSPYGLSLSKTKGFQSILDLQQDFGGNIVASLDYPLHPKLLKEEAEERLERSAINAIKAADSLQKNNEWNPFYYIAVHGQNRQQIEQYVQQIFKKFSRNKKLRNYPFGLAIGSLVPLRGSRKYATIIDLIRGVQQSIPEEKRSITPIHIFGITGSLIPVLSYLGVDTFDSSSYVQEARSLSYLEPITRIPLPILEMEHITCDCRVCQEANLQYIQEALISDQKCRPVHHGHYKSKYYADIALHNLEMDFQLVKHIREAIKANELQEYLIEYTSSRSHLNKALDSLSCEDSSLKTRLSRKIVFFPEKQELSSSESLVSYKYKPDSFNILREEFTPKVNQKILLILPCSGEKPYSNSRSHRLIHDRLEQSIGKNSQLIHKVTLSGLYGPVPEEYECKPPIMGYDFRLDPLDEKQIRLLTDRLVHYIQLHSQHYYTYIGYATSKAYRMVLEQTKKEASNLVVLPYKPKSLRLTEFFRKENIAELIKIVQSALKEVNLGDNGQD